MAQIEGEVQSFSAADDPQMHLKLALAEHQKVNDQFQRTFLKFNEVKRRNPNHYMNNPTKVHFATLGGRDYVFEDGAKERRISVHKNELKALRHDYQNLLPAAPKMSVERPEHEGSFSPTKYARMDSFITLGNAEQTQSSRHSKTVLFPTESSPTNASPIRLKPQSLARHKNSEFDQFLMKHAQGSPNVRPAPFPVDEPGR